MPGLTLRAGTLAACAADSTDSRIDKAIAGF